MKTLVIYYSRTGNNRQVAEFIAETLQAPIDEIVDKKKRSGRLGYMNAGRDSVGKHTTEIEVAIDPSAYDYLVLGTPKWAGGTPPAIRTYLTRYSLKGKKVAIFCVNKSGEVEKMLEELQPLLADAEVTTTLCFTEKMFQKSNWQTQVALWIATF